MIFFVNVYVNLENEVVVVMVVCGLWLMFYVLVSYEIFLEICEFERFLMIVLNVYL